MGRFEKIRDELREIGCEGETDTLCDINSFIGVREGAKFVVIVGEEVRVYCKKNEGGEIVRVIMDNLNGVEPVMNIGDVPKGKVTEIDSFRFLQK